MKTGMKTFMLIDAHALIHRAYHAMPYLTTKTGVPSGALFGLTNMILNAIEKFEPDYIFAANDLPKTTYREMAYEHYKAHRKATDDTLVEQIVLSPKVFESFGIPLLSMEGYEADDVIGTLVKKIQKKESKNKYQIIILTGDMDIMQLVDDDKVVVYTGRKGEENLIFNEVEVFAKHGLRPEQIPDYKGLRGDTSDNIPGIKGIGEKTAMQILQKGGSLKEVYKQIKKFSKDNDGDKAGKEFFGITERMYKLLKEGEEDAEFSRELATINCDIDVDIPKVEVFELLKNIEKLKEFCQEYNFLSIVRKLENLQGLKKPIVLNDFAEVIEVKGGEEVEEARPLAAPQEEAKQIEFSVDGLKKAQIAVWLLNSAEANVDAPRLQYLTKKNTEKEILEYLESEIKKKGFEELYFDMELPLIPILNSSNQVGIKVDREKLQKLLQSHEKEKEKLVSEIYKLAGREFNINSPKQMGEVLFNELKVQGEGGKLKKTDGGKISTRADVLEDLRDAHPIVSKLLDYRETEKMINTYLEPLLMHSTFDSRIHTTFLQTGSATGRFSSINPNMQNIPVKGEEGKKMRECFVASEGKVLVAADYSQIELRISGILSGDEYLQKIFKENSDVHTMIACKMFNKTASEITKDERNAAKAMNFGILYGMGVNSIKKTLKVERNIAQAFYDSYTMSVSGLMKYIKDTIASAKETGFTETLYGRQRQLPELSSNIPFIRASGERMAMNAPIQGTNADIIKFAMVDFHKKCVEKNWVAATAGSSNGLHEVSLGYKVTKCDTVSFLLQIHDEILFEVDESLVAEVSKELKKTMEAVLDVHKPKIPYTPIPIIVNVKTGKNWGDLE